jgi:alpha-tubulin suppressor-like RCC1 family protein
LKKNGEVFVIGFSNKGGLGLGDDYEEARELTKINGLKNITKIVAGSDFNVAVDANGTMWSWGLNNYGQLGNTSKLVNTFPKMIYIPSGKKVTDISCGDNFCLATTKEGEVLTWGCGTYGQLGQGNTQDLSAPKILPVTFKVKSISCGEAHSA